MYEDGWTKADSWLCVILVAILIIGIPIFFSKFKLTFTSNAPSSSKNESAISYNIEEQEEQEVIEYYNTD